MALFDEVKKEQLLAEVEELARTIPSLEVLQSEIEENLAWLGRLSAFVNVWSLVESARLGRTLRYLHSWVPTPSARRHARMGYGVAMQTRSYRNLSADERETLSVGLAHGHSLRAMTRVLGRVPSTVSREVA